MKIKIIPTSGPSSTLEIDETWTVRRLSIRHCGGYGLSAGFPPRQLPGGSLLSEEIMPGEVLRVLQQPMDEKALKKARKLEKKQQEMENDIIIEEDLQEPVNNDCFQNLPFAYNAYEEDMEVYDYSTEKSTFPNVQSLILCINVVI